MEEKERASRVFKDVWERCRAHEGYLEKKKVFVREQKLWDKEQKALGEVEREADVEDGSTEDVKKHADE